MSIHSDFMGLLRAGVTGGNYRVYDGQVTDVLDVGATYPYIQVTAIPVASQERSLARSVSAQSHLWRVTPAALTQTALLTAAQRVRDALEGARLGGHLVQEIPNNIGVMTNEKLVIEKKFVHFTKLEFQVMAPNR